MSAQEKQMLQNQVDHIAETLRNGMTFEDAGIDHEENGCEPNDMISGFDWLQDALDMEFTISSDGRFLGARVMVAAGGPDIWVDTRFNTIEGFWWGESARCAFFVDSMDIHGACQELFECR